MSFDGSDPCWIPDVPVNRTDKWRENVAQYGDGYAQRQLDGINALDKTFDVSFVNREASCINEMTDFLEAQKAKSFTFKEQMTGKLYQVTCDSWAVNWQFRRRHVGGDPTYIGTLSATFEKANGVTA